MHQRPASGQTGLGSQAQTLGFEGSQQTLLSSEGLKEKEGERKREVMSKGNSKQQMEALN